MFEQPIMDRAYFDNLADSFRSPHLWKYERRRSGGCATTVWHARAEPMARNVRLIARLDIKGPNLIKGIHLEGLRVIGDPQEFATRYYEQGADELIYMDIVASLYGRNKLTEIVQPRGARCLRADDGGRRHPLASTTCATCCAPAPTRSRSTPRRCAGRS